MIGFENKTKREAGANESAVGNSSQEAVGQAQAGIALKMETIARYEQLGGLICSDDFAKMAVTEKINVVRDFSYYSQVLATMP